MCPKNNHGETVGAENLDLLDENLTTGNTTWD